MRKELKYKDAQRRNTLRSRMIFDNRRKWGGHFTVLSPSIKNKIKIHPKDENPPKNEMTYF